MTEQDYERPGDDLRDDSETDEQRFARMREWADPEFTERTYGESEGKRGTP